MSPYGMHTPTAACFHDVEGDTDPTPESMFSAQPVLGYFFPNFLPKRLGTTTFLAGGGGGGLGLGEGAGQVHVHFTAGLGEGEGDGDGDGNGDGDGEGDSTTMYLPLEVSSSRA